MVRDILSVTYKDSVQEIDSFEITINNWDAETRAFKYSDQRLFDPGERVELYMGYQGALRPMLDRRDHLAAAVVPVGRRLDAGGQRPQRPAPLPHAAGVAAPTSSMTDSQIAEQIAAAAQGRQSRPDASTDEPRFNYLIQDNQYDIIFLMERARRVGYDLFVEERKDGQSSRDRASSTSRRRRCTTPTYRLTYGKSLIEFQPELTTANQVGKVTVRGWDACARKPIIYTATRDELEGQGRRRPRRPGRDREVDRAEGRDRRHQAGREPRRRRASWRSRSSRASPRTWSRRTGSVPGLPDLRAGTVLEIDGLGDRFSGRYFVASTTHTIGDSGYTTQFECRREEV